MNLAIGRVSSPRLLESKSTETVETSLMAIPTDEADNLENFLRVNTPGDYPQLQTFQQNAHQSVASVKALADACRTPEWRLPLARAGFLSLIKDLSTSPDQRDLNLQVLRFIANCCAENDTCREMVFKDLDRLAICLGDDTLFDFAVVALNNICEDSDIACGAALQHNVHVALIKEIGQKSQDPQRESISMATNLLISLACTAVATHITNRILPDSFMNAVLALPLKFSDFDLYSELLEMVKVLLQDDDVQAWIAQGGSMAEILTLLEDLHNRIDQPTKRRIEHRVAAEDNAAEEPEELGALEKHAEDIRTSLCDIAAMRAYREEKLRGNHHTVQTLGKWLAEWTCDWKMQTAALVLGNFAQSDQVATSLVNELELNHAVTAAIKWTSDKHVLHACGGLLRNLCLPEENTVVRASAETFVAARTLMLHPDHDKRIFLAGLRLLRQCLRDFGACQLLILQEPAEPRLSLKVIFQSYAEFGRGDEQLVAEMGRLTVMMYRTCSRAKCPTVPNLLQILNGKQQLTATMVDLTVPGPLEAEGWFGLALAAKTTAGALAVYRALEQGRAVERLIERVQGKEEACIEGERTKSLENAKVLAATLVNMIPDQLEQRHLEALKVTKRSESSTL